jgi:O-acetyl-ADP-ribose deacetylase (regulator of RNase III)
MIKEVSGDILLSKAQVIAHGVAPNDPFHNGLALQLREQWPAM